MLLLLQSRLDSFLAEMKTGLMHDDLTLAGWRSLAYAAVFGQGLTRTELPRFLISPHTYTTGSVEKLWSTFKVRGFVRSSQRPNQRTHWEHALAVRSLAYWVPWVQSIWVTGSLAAGTAHLDDDIDFLVITDRQRLWLSRLILVGLSILVGRARTRTMAQNRVQDRWCFNMWLEPEKMELSASARNLYTAREVIQAVPLYVRADVKAETFLDKNDWAQQFYATGWKSAYKLARYAHRSEVLLGVQKLPLSFVNTLAWIWQKGRIGRSKTREIVENNQALFHPRDTRKNVANEYERISTLLGI